MAVEHESAMWGIHGGKTGDADSLFVKQNRVAVGWDKMGDLTLLAADREAFKTKVLEVHPDKKPGAIPNNAGQLFRFVHEVRPGDIIVYPSKNDHQVHLGTIEGGYQFNTKLEPSYAHLRAVKWLKSVPRTQFTQGALYKIGVN